MIELRSRFKRQCTKQIHGHQSWSKINTGQVACWFVRPTAKYWDKLPNHLSCVTCDLSLLCVAIFGLDHVFVWLSVLVEHPPPQEKWATMWIKCHVARCCLIKPSKKCHVMHNANVYVGPSVNPLMYLDYDVSIITPTVVSGMPVHWYCYSPLTTIRFTHRQVCDSIFNTMALSGYI